MKLWADISNFMTWFIASIINIFTWIWNRLENFEFAGTNLLKVIIFINVIIPLIYVVITIVQTSDNGVRAATRYNDKVRKENAKWRNNE